MKLNAKISWLSLGLELLVVFLGITAGFFLQDYSVRRQESELERNYLEGFRADLQVNETMLREQIADDSSWVARHIYALPQLRDHTLPADSANSLVIGMTTYSRFARQDITYLNIVNSGSLGLISDYALRSAIVAYHKEIEDFDLMEDYIQHYVQNDLMPFLSSRFDIIRQTFRNPDTYQDIEFRNAFGFLFSFRQQRLRAYRELLDSTLELKELLGTES